MLTKFELDQLIKTLKQAEGPGCKGEDSDIPIKDNPHIDALYRKYVECAAEFLHIDEESFWNLPFEDADLLVEHFCELAPENYKIPPLSFEEEMEMEKDAGFFRAVSDIYQSMQITHPPPT